MTDNIRPGGWLLSDASLFLAAIIWGGAFVFQKIGSDYLDAFVYNGLRFAVGAAALLPLCIVELKKRNINLFKNSKTYIKQGVIAGFLLFAGITLQQIGIAGSTSGKAGFITAIYVILVPLIGRVWGYSLSPKHLFSAFLAVIGLFLLTISETFGIERGDLIILAGALFWALHVIYLGRVASRGVPVITLSALQFFMVALYCLLLLPGRPLPAAAAIYGALPAVLYGGLGSCAVGFTLQLFGQRQAPPAHAAIILSSEALFAMLFGFLLLGETASTGQLFGCLLMLVAIIVSRY